MLLVRRTPERADWLESSEYAQVDPEDLEWTLRQASESSGFADAVVLEVERRLREDPESRRAQKLRNELKRLEAGTR